MNLAVYIFFALGILILAAVCIVFFTNCSDEKITDIKMFATIDSTNSKFSEHIIKELICNSKILNDRGIKASIYIVCDIQDTNTAQIINILNKKEANLHMVQIG